MSGMGMNHIGHVPGFGIQLHGQCRFMNQVRRMGSNQMRPQHPIRLRVGQNFHQPHGITNGMGLA